MENYDRRRRQSDDDERYRARPGYEDRGGERELSRQWPRETDRPRRAERGWLDYDLDYGRSEERQGRREEPRYGQGGAAERASFSPDWSRADEEPRYSDDPYYARNREQDASSDYARRGRSESFESGDERRTWDQRARASVPREQHEMAERSRPGDYYSPDWPYERGRGRALERSRDDEQQRHYRGYYSRSTTPFSYPGGQGYLYSESWTLHGPYTGRGPKGYKRSDQQIIEEACQRLERDGDVDASDIEVSAEEGVIRLRGTVPDRTTKRKAEECVESIYGVRDVMNELRVSAERQQTRGSEDWPSAEGTQMGRGSQAAQGAQPSQASQASPGVQSSTGAQSAQSPAARAGGTPASAEEPGEEKRAPRH